MFGSFWEATGPVPHCRINAVGAGISRVRRYGYRPRNCRACRIRLTDDDIGSCAQTGFVLRGNCRDGLIRFCHQAVEARVDFLFRSEKARKILHPFKMADGDAAVFFNVVMDLFRMDAAGVQHAARRGFCRNDFAAVLIKQARGFKTDIAEALDRAARRGERNIALLRRYPCGSAHRR